MGVRWVVGFLTLAAGLQPTAAIASVWNGLEFGTPLAEFQKQYPQAESTVAGDAAEALPYLNYRLGQRAVGTLSPCDLEFSFTGKERVLYRLEARCQNDPADVLRYLTGTYGHPDQVSATILVWRRGPTEVTFQPKAGVFTVADAERSRSVAAALMRMLQRVPLGDTTPAATPAQQP